MMNYSKYSNKILKQMRAMPNDDEMEAAMHLVDNGTKSVLFLERDLSAGTRTPDVLIDKRFRWEIKTPIKFTRYSLEHAFRAAKDQSENVIFYLKYNKIPDKNVIRSLERQFNLIKKAKRLKIITKSGKILDFEK